MNHAGNQPPHTGDYMDVECTEVRTLLSSVLDGDLAPSRDLEAHLAGCAECRGWRDDAAALASLAQEPVAGEERRFGLLPGLPRGFTRYRWIRFALAWAGLLLLVWHAPGMFDSSVDLSALHVTRHQHTFGVALGLTFLFVAWRPDRAYGLVPVAAVFTVALGGAALVDLINGSSTLSRESVHIVEIVGLAFLWALGWSAGPGRRRGGSMPPPV